MNDKLKRQLPAIHFSAEMWYWLSRIHVSQWFLSILLDCSVSFTELEHPCYQVLDISRHEFRSDTDKLSHTVMSWKKKENWMKNKLTKEKDEQEKYETW